MNRIRAREYAWENTRTVGPDHTAFEILNTFYVSLYDVMDVDFVFWRFSYCSSFSVFFKDFQEAFVWEYGLTPG